MDTARESIAATAATSRSGFLTADELRAEASYLRSVHIAKRWLAQGLIDKAAYRRIEKKLREKYTPIFDDLFAKTA